MSQFQYKNPWDPGYAIPKYVLAEPQGRGTFTTRQLPRGTISQVPKDLHNGGFAVPKYAKRRFGENPLVTNMIPRRTVSTFAPDIFQRPKTGGQGPVEHLIAVGSTLDGSTLGGSTLGALGDFAPGTKVDPILTYGKKAARWITTEAKKLPPRERAKEVKKLLHAIDASLPAEVENKTQLYKDKGYGTKDAFHRALAASLSNHLVAEFVRLGKGELPDPLGDVYAELGGFWSAVATPFKYAAKGVKATAGFVGTGVKKVGSLTCGVAKSPVGLIAGGATGGVAGAAGVQVVAGMCPSGTVPVAPVPADGGFGFGGIPVLPIALIGGALVLVVALK